MSVCDFGEERSEGRDSRKMPRGLGKLSRAPSFTMPGRGMLRLDPALRFSLSRLVEAARPRHDAPSPAAEARFAASWQLRFREEWERLREAVRRLFHWPADSPEQLDDLTALHNDVHVLQRSQAGVFIFEYYQSTLLPDAIEPLVVRLLDTSTDQLATVLALVWTNFYCHTLPALQAIFVSVKHQRLSVRQATLVAFRDCVLLQLEHKMAPLLEDLFSRGAVPPALRQMLLVLQGVTECYPPSDKRLRLEQLVARAVSPYLGYKGLYVGGCATPSVPSREIDVARLRRPSVADGGRLSRPLSTSAARVETLGDLFALSADRLVGKHRTPS